MMIATMNVQMAVSKVEQALEAMGDEAPPNALVAASSAAREAGKNAVTLDIATLSRSQDGKAFLKALASTDLTKQQRLQVQACLGEEDLKVLDEIVKSPAALEKILKLLMKPGEPTVEIQVGGRWYPVPVTNVVYNQDRSYGSGSSTYIQASASVCGTAVSKHSAWTDSDFREDNNPHVQVARRVGDLLDESGIRLTTKEAVEEQRSKKDKAEKMAGKHGFTVAVAGAVLVANKYLWAGGLDAVPLGTEEKPCRCVVEDALEKDDRNGGFSYGRAREDDFALPLIRIFSLDLKKYVFADIDDVSSYEWDVDAESKLILPPSMHRILGKIFNAPSDRIFGDLFKGRHGGMVILANGPQGTGKTLTAEVFAEKTKRPLYVLEMGELGTDLKQVEESLQRVFARAARWNAVLLFDEADVFLAKREEADLERSAIVGVFLRLLDRYEGMFFLTTNRAEVIDPAFRSRITLKLDYGTLTPEQRTSVWQKMIAAAGITVTGDMTKVYEQPLDGRQIRNQVRLLGVLYGTEATSADFEEAVQYVAVNKGS